MKCQECEKPATFHITELTDPDQPIAVHLCEDCAKEYLSQSPDKAEAPLSVAGAIQQQIKVHQTAEELAKLDQTACPICGITFYEFRKLGRLGCPHDYEVFQEDMEPLIVNIHGAVAHVGKRPKRSQISSDVQTELMRLRREMIEAVEKEAYERASELRDRIRELEETQASGASTADPSGPTVADSAASDSAASDSAAPSTTDTHSTSSDDERLEDHQDDSDSD